MPSCCSAGDLDDIFTPAQARADARAYRRSGLDAEAKRIADAVRRIAGERVSILEVGGGIGAIQVDLLRGGAISATNVELSRSYESLARDIAEDAGVGDRVTRRVGDFVVDADQVPRADAVILQRVVCCYPFASALVEAAADHAVRVLVMTFPRDSRLMRAAFAVVNLWPRIMRSKFRAYVHPTREVVAAAERKGLRLVEHRPGFVWQMLVLARGSV